MKREFAVIGLGRFGGSICRELSMEGMDVLAIDVDEDKVNEFKNFASYAVIADSTDEAALKELGIKNIDHVIVAIGDNIQASILTTVILTDLGIKKITVKAQNDYHEKILKKIGADQVVHPERDMGKRIAHNIISNNILDYLELSDEHSIVEVKVGERMLGKTLVDLDIRANYGCNVVAIKRGKEINVSPSADDALQKSDILIVIGADNDISRFERHLVVDDDDDEDL
ncbi:TrkA family potassium uptake protein [Aciduricibacillus chroicocephali]|uniref:TrkA family potassium uptake protein n=1 Tax=Aciduricibacillus chroicocephali TaxID=3054939 RepID=A0ABY9KXN0_9BACI|nr:TrkA family potassium uptake protein [Bacillaceae bacterium 44XB]